MSALVWNSYCMIRKKNSISYRKCKLNYIDLYLHSRKELARMLHWFWKIQLQTTNDEREMSHDILSVTKSQFFIVEYFSTRKHKKSTFSAFAWCIICVEFGSIDYPYTFNHYTLARAWNYLPARSTCVNLTAFYLSFASQQLLEELLSNHRFEL